MARLRRGGAAVAAGLLLFASSPVADAQPPSTSPTGPTSAPPTRSTTAPTTTTPVWSNPMQTTQYDTVDAPFALTVSPTRIVVGSREAGGVHELLVINQGTEMAQVTVEERDFTGGADGSLQFRDEAKYSASGWVTVAPAVFTLKPGSAQAVKATIDIPAEPEPGDHQVALVFLVQAGTTANNVRVNRGVAAPVYVAVTGTADTFTTIDQLTAPGFALDGPVQLSTTVRDMGTVHRDFRGSTALRVEGSGEVTTFPDFTVLRGGTRDVSTMWEPPLMCVCHPKVTVTNANGQTMTATATVVVIPFHLIGIALAAIVLVWFIIRLTRRRYRAAVAAAAAAQAGGRHEEQ